MVITLTDRISSLGTVEGKLDVFLSKLKEQSEAVIVLHKQTQHAIALGDDTNHCIRDITTRLDALEEQLQTIDSSSSIDRKPSTKCPKEVSMH